MAIIIVIITFNSLLQNTRLQQSQHEKLGNNWNSCSFFYFESIHYVISFFIKRFQNGGKTKFGGGGVERN